MSRVPWREHWPIPACAVVYLVFVVANGIVWESAHDEGVTFFHAIGNLSVSDEASNPDRLVDLYGTIDARSEFSSGDVIQALTNVLGGGMHPPGYYLFINRWSHAVGTGKLALRLPTYLVGVLSLVAISLLGRRLVPWPRAEHWAPLLLALSPWFLGFSNYARPYAMALCIALWSTVSLLELTSGRHHTRWRAAFVVLSILGLYVIYHYAFVLAWHSILLALIAWGRGPAERWREFAKLAGMGAIVIAGFLPWAPYLLGHVESVRALDFYFKTSIPPSQWASAAGSMLLHFGLGEAASGRFAALALSLLVACTLPLVPLSFSARAQARLGRPARLAWWTMPLLPLLVVAGDVGLGSQSVFITKTVFALLPLLILVIVRAWCFVPARVLRVAGLASWSFVLAASMAGDLYARAGSTTDFERVARDLRAIDSPSQVILVSSVLPGYLVPMLLTLRDAGVRDSRMIYAAPSRLSGVVDALARDPSVRRMSLVNFKVGYGSPSFQKAHTWAPQQLRLVVQRAEVLGWEARRLDRGGALSRGGGERILSVAPAVYVKYFSM